VAAKVPPFQDPPTTGGLVDIILNDIDRVGRRR
jgi:hypothetical protein